MNINPVNINSVYKFFNGARKQNVGVSSNPFESGSNENLAPLSKDTVSFSGSAKLTGKNMVFAPSAKVCKMAHHNAEPAQFYLQQILDRYLGPINEQSPDKPLITVSTRTKSDTSIREKVVSKYAKIASDELNEFCDSAINEIFEYFNFKDGFTKEMARVEAKILTDFISEFQKVPPYKNERFYLSEIVKNLEVRKLICFNPDKASDINQAFNEMEANLSSITHKSHCEKDGTYIPPMTMNGIKHYANDIVGARIILNDSNPKTTQKVITALKQASKDGFINITSIENNLPDVNKLPKNKKIGDYEYVSERMLKNLAESSASEYHNLKSKSGYLAIHINLDLTSPKLDSEDGSYNGFQGEIQIMDANVEQLKDIEDLCYKLKDEKNAFRTKYLPFKEHFKKYYKKPNVMKAFDDYTYNLYLAQRRKTIENKGYGKFFPSLSELGFDKLVPSQLDFNYLKSLKDLCDIEPRDKKGSITVDNPGNIDVTRMSPEVVQKLKKILFELGFNK